MTDSNAPYGCAPTIVSPVPSGAIMINDGVDLAPVSFAIFYCPILSVHIFQNLNIH